MNSPIDLSWENIAHLKSKIKRTRKNLKLICQNATDFRSKHLTESVSAYNITNRSNLSKKCKYLNI